MMPTKTHEKNGKAPATIPLIADGKSKERVARQQMLEAMARMRRMQGCEADKIAAELAELNSNGLLDPAAVDAIAAAAAEYDPAALQQAVEQDYQTAPKAPALPGDDDDDVPDDEEIAELNAIDGPLTTDPGPLPAQLLKPGGLLGRVMEHTLATATKPNPPLALAGAFALMGTLLGRKVVADGGRTHAKVYALAIADTGDGKEWPRQVNAELLTRSGEMRLLGGANLNSHAGVISMLSEWPVRLVQIDELGRYLAQANGKTANQHAQTVITSLLTLATGKDYHGEGLKDRKACRPVLRHHMCVLGSSTPDSFYGALSTEACTSGLLNRCMIFPGQKHPRIKRDDECGPADPPDHLIAEVAAWTGWRKNNLRPVHVGSDDDGDMSAPIGAIKLADLHVCNVPTDQDAADHLWAFCLEREEMKKVSDPITGALLSRDWEKARRVALIIACSSGTPDEHRLRITLDDARYATQLVDYMTRYVIYQAHGRIIDDVPLSIGKLAIKACDWMRSRTDKNGNPLNNAKVRELGRKFNLETRDRDKLIDYLIDTGRVRAEDTGKSGKGSKSRTLWLV